MIRVRPRLSRVLLATALAAAIPASALAAPMFLKLGGVDGESKDDKHMNQIEILSWSWGETQAGKVETEWKVEKGEKAASGEKGGTEDITIGVGELRRTAATPGEAEITLKGNKIGENAQSGEWIADVERPAEATGKSTPPTVTLKRGTSAAEATGGVQVAAGDVTGDGAAAAKLRPGTRIEVKVTRPEAASGPKMVLARPLPNGSVRVKVRFPWLACRVGARYPELELGDGTTTHKLKNAVVTSCGSGEGAQPAEEIAFNYEEIK